jgi:hypothetical protein
MTAVKLTTTTPQKKISSNFMVRSFYLMGTARITKNKRGPARPAGKNIR